MPGKWLLRAMLCIVMLPTLPQAQAQTTVLPLTAVTVLQGASLPNPILQVAIHNGTLYVLGLTSMYSFSLGNPQNPIPRAVFQARRHFNLSAVAFVGRYAYLAGTDGVSGGATGFRGALAVVDLIDPVRPRTVGEYLTPLGPSVARFGLGVTVSGQFAFLSLSRAEGILGRSGDLRVLNIADPARPRQVASFDEGLAWSSERLIPFGSAVLALPTCVAIVSDCGFALKQVTYSAGQPLRYTDLYTVTNESGASVALTGLDVSGQLAVLSAGAQGLRIVDVTNPLTPTLRSQLNVGGNTADMAVASGLAYIVVTQAIASPAVPIGLAVVDLRQPDAPRIIATYAATQPGKLAATGLLSYLQTGDNQLTILRLGDRLRAPVVLGGGM